MIYGGEKQNNKTKYSVLKVQREI